MLNYGTRFYGVGGRGAHSGQFSKLILLKREISFRCRRQATITSFSSSIVQLTQLCAMCPASSAAKIAFVERIGCRNLLSIISPYSLLKKVKKVGLGDHGRVTTTPNPPPFTTRLLQAGHECCDHQNGNQNNQDPALSFCKQICVHFPPFVLGGIAGGDYDPLFAGFSH